MLVLDTLLEHSILFKGFTHVGDTTGRGRQRLRSWQGNGRIVVLERHKGRIVLERQPPILETFTN
jgi:hypothetical protein